MTLPKFLLSGFSTIVILLIGWPIVMMYPSIMAEKATGFAALVGCFTEAVFTPLFWLSAVLLLLFFWYTSQLGSKILRLVLFWMPTILATLIGATVFPLAGYAVTHGPR